MNTRIARIIGDCMFVLWGIVSDAILELYDRITTPRLNPGFGSEKLIASRFNKGFLISRHRRLTRRQSAAGLLILGSTGSGKTVRLLSKQLYLLKNSTLIINDPSKELYNLSSGYLSQYYTVKTLNFSNNRESSGYNVLSRCKTQTDINKVAEIITRGSIGKGNSDPYWSIQSTKAIQLAARLLMHQSKEYLNMANVVRVVKFMVIAPKKLDIYFVQSHDEQLIQDWMVFSTTPEKTLQNILSTTLAALQIFQDEEVARTTSVDTLDFDMLRAKPHALFLHTDIGSLHYMSHLTGIFFEQFYSHVLRRLPTPEELDVYVILEEASSLYIPSLATAIVNTRKHRVANLLCLQSQGFLKTMYGEHAENIISNCGTRILLPGSGDIATLNEFALLGGKTTYTEKGSEKTKQLITPHEARVLGDDNCLIINSNKPLIKARTSPYFNSFRYKGYSMLPPIPFSSDIPDAPIALLPQLKN